MTTNVLPFTQQQPFTQETPTPASYREGNQYFRVNLTDDLYEGAGYRAGAVLIAQDGLVVAGQLHYVEIGNYGLLAHIMEDPSGLHLLPLDGLTAPGIYSRADMSYVGVIVEAYPQGLPGARWLLDLSDSINAARLLLRAIAN